MYYVYLIQSIPFPEQTYLGYTHHLKTRLENHNAGKTRTTMAYKPWKFIAFFGFSNKMVAQSFEKYLKSHSGRAFMQKHFYTHEKTPCTNP